MNNRHQTNLLGDIIALLLIAALIIAALEWFGWNVGWRPWLACKLQGSQGLVNLGVIVGVGLLFFRRTRSAGAGVLFLTLGSIYAQELLGISSVGACAGVHSNP